MVPLEETRRARSREVEYGSGIPPPREAMHAHVAEGAQLSTTMVDKHI